MSASSMKDCLALCNLYWHYFTTGGMRYDDLVRSTLFSLKVLDLMGE